MCAELLGEPQISQRCERLARTRVTAVGIRLRPIRELTHIEHSRFGGGPRVANKTGASLAHAMEDGS